MICRSRLGCQVKLTKELDGMIATLPSATRNMYVDGESSLSLFPSPLSLHTCYRKLMLVN